MGGESIYWAVDGELCSIRCVLIILIMVVDGNCYPMVINELLVSILT